MSKSQKIICFGEILWDALPAGLFLGGAPLNVCLHLHQLGVPAEMVSRVGKDRLGREALSRIERQGLGTAYIQRDDEHETGFVQVALDTEGAPDYEIIQPAAWDYIDVHERVAYLLNGAWAVVFGTLAQRGNKTFESLLKINGLKVLDMNLRSPHYAKDYVKYMIDHSDFIKMNEDELTLLQEWYTLPESPEEAARALSSRCNCRTVCVTRGERGSMLLHNKQWLEHAGYPVEVEDSVGAGDAFLAALLYGIKSRKAEDKLLPFANAVGAFVAGHSGANPGYSIPQIEAIRAKGGLVK